MLQQAVLVTPAGAGAEQEPAPLLAPGAGGEVLESRANRDGGGGGGRSLQSQWDERGSGSGAGKLVLRLRTVRDIAAGEELCISYLNSLYTSFPERDERLQEVYFFGADTLGTDAGLEALVRITLPPLMSRNAQSTTHNAQPHPHPQPQPQICERRHRCDYCACYGFRVSC